MLYMTHSNTDMEVYHLLEPLFIMVPFIIKKTLIRQSHRISKSVYLTEKIPIQEMEERFID